MICLAAAGMRKRTSKDCSISNCSNTFISNNNSYNNCAVESTRSVRCRAPEIERKLTGVNETSRVPAVTTVPPQHLNNPPKPAIANCALISTRRPVADFVYLLSSSDKSNVGDYIATGCNNIALNNNNYSQLLKPANHNKSCLISESGQKINNEQVSISYFRSSAASDKNQSDNLKGLVPIVHSQSVKTHFANKTQRVESNQIGHLFTCKDKRNNNYSQSDNSSDGHRRLSESATEKIRLQENCSPDKQLTSSACDLKIIEEKVNFCNLQKTFSSTGSHQSRVVFPKMNNCYNYSSNCAQLLQPEMTFNPCAASSVDSRQNLHPNYYSANGHVTQNYVTSTTSCQNKSFASLMPHDYGQQHQNTLNGGVVLQNITNNNFNNKVMMNQVNSHSNIPSSYPCNYNSNPQQIPSTHNNLGYNSEDSLSDKENNFVNIAKMDSSYFSLSTEELSSQSESTGSGCTSETRTSKLSTEGFNSANSNSCDVESDEGELQIDEDVDDDGNDYDCDENGTCASDESCDCDSEDSSKSSTTYNDENKSCDTSGNSESDISDISSDTDDKENTISYSAGAEDSNNPTYIDEDVSLKTNMVQNNSTSHQPDNSGGALRDITSQYNSSEVTIYQRMLQDKVNGHQTKTKELTPVTTSMDTTMMPADVNFMKPKTNVKPLEPCSQAMTPDTIAATRKIMADTPLTPTTSKMGNLTMKPVELYCPIPNLNWGDNWVCWEEMLAQDDIQHRLAKDSLAKHPRLSKDHRTIVLEWLSEVTLNYRMRKDSFYLAVNFFDRFLACTNDLGSDKLQLLGTTALFTASKVEEIYPPSSREFASITNGQCDVDELIETEICLVNYLGWKLKPATALQWILLYLQMYLYSASDDDCLAAILTLATGDRHSTNNLIVNPNFEPLFYHKATCILDLCTLSYESTEYKPRLLAAAVILSLDFTFMRMFGFLDKTELQRCFYWLKPFVTVASKTFDQETLFKTRYRNNIMLHHHTATMECFKEATALANQNSSSRALFVNNMQPSPFEIAPDAQMGNACTDESQNKDDDAVFSLNPEDQINMVLLSPPYDS